MKALVIIITLFWVGPVLGAGVAPTNEMGVPFDPTKNVIDLVKSAVQRLDDIQELQKKNIEALLVLHSKMLEDKLNTFMVTSERLAAAEKSRVDAIRAVDTSNANIDRERATTQAQVLAAQVQASAENLRLLVATTAEATAKQNVATLAELGKRITDLEKIQNASLGASGGIRDLWPIIFGIVMTLIAIASFIVPKLKAEPNGRTKREVES